MKHSIFVGICDKSHPLRYQGRTVRGEGGGGKGAVTHFGNLTISFFLYLFITPENSMLGLRA